MSTGLGLDGQLTRGYGEDKSEQLQMSHHQGRMIREAKDTYVRISMINDKN